MIARPLVFLLLILLLLPCGASSAQSTNDLALWYDKPAQSWTEALPIGNGRLAAMIFGGISTEQLQLNEATVWAGQPGNNNPPPGFKQSLNQVRQLIFQEKYKEAQDLLSSNLTGEPGNTSHGMPYQTMGSLFIEFPDHKNITGYKRDLDISEATASVHYVHNGVKFSRKMFASLVDDVIIIKLAADKPGSISCNLRVNTPHSNHHTSVENNEIILTGTTSDHENKKGRIHFTTIIEAVTQGGRSYSSDSTLTIQDADEVTIYLSAATNFRHYNDISGNSYTKAHCLLTNVIKKKYENVLAAHIHYYQNFFNRVSFSLQTKKPDAKSTDVRLKEFANGDDLSLLPLYFQFGRYLLISCSQPKSQPATLQGLWNDQLLPPWDSKYTININTEMNYWPAEVTNLSELHQPLFSMLKDLSITGQETARQMYGARGWVVHHNTDLWRITGPVDGAYYGMWPMGGAWLSQHIWQHYQFNGNKKFLAEYYNILKDVALFYSDVLQEEPQNNWLVISPSMSPENEHHPGISTTAGATMDNQLLFDVFHNFIEASDILKKDQLIADTIAQKLERIPPMQIGKFGQLQEWLHDWDRKEDQHRHVSHLYGLYPSSQISLLRTPELFAAARQSLLYRGDKSTGWSMGWKVNLWARLLDGNHAYQLIRDQLTPSAGNEGGTYPNLLDAHPPFQIDGNFGCTSGIAEMLMQSHDGAIHVLPALPDEWDTGHIKGLKAQGGFTVNIKWKGKKVVSLTIHSSLGGQCRLRSNSELTDARLQRAEGENKNPFFNIRDTSTPKISDQADLPALPATNFFEYDLFTKAGTTYDFVFSN